jgi:hypothetical protein
MDGLFFIFLNKIKICIDFILNNVIIDVCVCVDLMGYSK